MGLSFNTIEAASRSRVRVAQAEETIQGQCPSVDIDVTSDFSFVDSNPDTITRAAGSFITDGFLAGDKVTVYSAGDTSLNDGQTFTIAAGGVAALALTLEAADAVVVEGPVNVQLLTQRITYLVLPHRDNTFLNQTQTFERSTEVRSNRMGGTQVGGTIEVGGTVSVPLKLDNGVRELLESAYSSVFAPIVSDAAAAGTTFSFVDSDPDTITRAAGSFVADGILDGDLITVSGTASNNGTFTVATVAPTTITLIASDTLIAEAAVATAVITTEREIMSANATRKSFTYEVSYLDAAVPEYETFFGVEVNTATITVPTSGEVFMDCEMMGIGSSAHTIQAPNTPTYVDAAATVPMAGSVAGSSLEEAATALQGVETMTITINNNRAAKFQVGDRFASHIEEGDWDAEITMSIYFSDSTLQQKFLAGTRTDLIVTVADQQDDHRFRFTFPNIVFTTGDKALSGQTITQNFTAFAEEDKTITPNTKALLEWIPATVGAP